MNDVADNTSQSTGKRTIRKLQVRNLFSFGEKGIDLELLPLNVLIGANNTGKSNLINVLRLIGALPRGFSELVARLGGMSDILFKGLDRPTGRIAFEISGGIFPRSFQYRLTFTGQLADHNLLKIIGEIAEYLSPSERDDNIILFYNDNWTNVQHYREIENKLVAYPEQAVQLMSKYEPFIAQIRDPAGSQYLSALQGILESFRFAHLPEVVGASASRLPQRTDQLSSYLFGDGSNLAAVLNRIESNPNGRKALVSNLQKLNPLIDHIGTLIEGGTAKIIVQEKGLLYPISANRLSDGTLSFLALLAVLLNPDPPPLICIEEPEIGLHPDMLLTVAELLKEASQRSQIIVTTHSDMLVSALSDMPEAVVVCERDQEGSQFRRLEPEKLEKWLRNYSLGDLWQMGEIGGTRW